MDHEQSGRPNATDSPADSATSTGRGSPPVHRWRQPAATTDADDRPAAHPEPVRREPSRFDVRNPNDVHPLVWNAMIVACLVAYAFYPVLVRQCHDDGSLTFQTSASVILVVECVKLILTVAALTFLRDPDAAAAVPSMSWSSVAYAFFPALLYCFTNNVAVYVQLEMDETSYRVLGNSAKILTTAVVYRLAVGHQLPSTWWTAVATLIAGSAVTSYGGVGLGDRTATAASAPVDAEEIRGPTGVGFALLVLYSTASGLAGVCSEYQLKAEHDVPIARHNRVVYVYGVVLNGIAWAVTTAGGRPSTSWNPLSGYSFQTWLLVVSQAFVGLTLAVVLKYANNMTRLYVVVSAALLGNVLTAVVFRQFLDACFVFGFLLVALSRYIYMHRPHREF